MDPTLFTGKTRNHTFKKKYSSSKKRKNSNKSHLTWKLYLIKRDRSLTTVGHGTQPSGRKAATAERNQGDRNSRAIFQGRGGSTQRERIEKRKVSDEFPAY